MKGFLAKLKTEARLLVQLGFSLLTNANLPGFVRGSIYQGPLKKFCLPGLNCYSCPGALGACPIGALQAVAAGKNSDFSFYVAGFLILVGVTVGRLVCGWLCPFGLVQDLLHRLPGKKIRKIPGDRWLEKLRYVILAVLVLLLPALVTSATGLGTPWYCKWICPSGTLLGGIPLMIANPALRAAAGWLFSWKMLVLLVFLVLSVFIFRPFCRWFCPLGAVYGLCNPVSLYRYRVEADACIHCGQCQSACGLDIPVHEKPNSPACIRCGKCVGSCPTGAIRCSFLK